MTTQAEEAYVCIYSHRYADTILFHHEGGVDIGDVDAKVILFSYLCKLKFLYSCLDLLIIKSPFKKIFQFNAN